MGTILNPYLSFGEKAREAMEFYRSALGGELTLSTFGESGMNQDPKQSNLVMHAQLNASNGMVLMGSDTPSHMGTPRGNGSISLSGDDEGALRRYWEKLSEGATIVVPLEKAPWGDTFGMLTDKFDVQWMVNIVAKRT
jgi:PhnB protein